MTSTGIHNRPVVKVAVICPVKDEYKGNIQGQF